jgi:hypothetical protein
MTLEANTSQHFTILSINFCNYMDNDIYYQNENNFSVW